MYQPGDKPNLNDQQRQAVAHSKGPALVVAGAGTGKTRVLTERIARLAHEGVAPENILALTFTEKAAAEMQDRVHEATGTYQSDMPLMTFNAFGESLLREFAAEIGLGRNFRVMGDDAQIVFLRERLDELGLDYYAPVARPDSQLGNLTDYFSKLKQNVVTPQAYTAFLDTLPATDEAEQLEKSRQQELCACYEAYIRLSREANVIDYDDQIYLLIELLRARPNVLRTLQARYAYVLVDEFQDTNAMQSTLVDMLVGSAQNLFVVGDDDQSIYGWRGATLANMLDFKQRYPKAKDITLIHNYRSTQPILDAAYRLIKHNDPDRLETRLKINKRLVSDRKGSEPTVYSFDSLDEELHWLAQDIASRLEAGTSPSDIAILGRRNATLSRLSDQLHYAGVDHLVVGQRFNMYREPVVRSLLEVLKAVADPTDNTSLYHALVGPLFGLPVHIIGDAIALAKQHHQSLHKVLEEMDGIKPALDTLKQWRELSATMSVGQLTYHVMDDSGYKDQLYTAAYTDQAVAVSASRLAELFHSMKEFEQVAIQPSVVQYLDALPALQAADGTSEDGTLDLSQDVVSILSIHKAKGLEWPTVYIVDCTEGSFPLAQRHRGMALPEALHTQSDPADAHIAEERRLMYVAMTRAKNELIMTYATRHTSSQARKPSRFLEETFGTTDFPSVESQKSLELAGIGGFGLSQHQQVAIPSSILNGTQVKLTISQAKKYMECPLDFYYSYVLQVPRPTTPSQLYGNLMHSLLEDINRCLLEGKSLPSLKTLQQTLLERWPQTGYLSAAQRARALEKGKATLDRLYQDIQSQPRAPLAVEEAFRVNIPGSNLTLRGRYDAVFTAGNSVEIVDYKTASSADTPERAKQKATTSEQLTLYALAWQLQHDELPALVTLDFIETGQKGSLKKTQRGIDGAYQRLQKVADGIRAHDFRPGKSHDFCIHPEV